MELKYIREKIPEKIFSSLQSSGIKTLTPVQEKAVNSGLFDGKSLLVCSPTASGKTLIAELAAAKSIVEKNAKAVYIVPLKALACEKYNDFNEKYGDMFRIALSIGDLDSTEPRLSEYDIIVCTAEKLDSLIRHGAMWLRSVSTVIIDEVHLLNDAGRGPTLEILITILRNLLKGMQLIALSATIGNPEELSSWLGAELVSDSWRPTKLSRGIYFQNKIRFHTETFETPS